MSLGNFRGINGAHLRIYEPGKLLMVKICSNVKMRAHANFYVPFKEARTTGTVSLATLLIEDQVLWFFT